MTDGPAAHERQLCRGNAHKALERNVSIPRLDVFLSFTSALHTPADFGSHINSRRPALNCSGLAGLEIRQRQISNNFQTSKSHSKYRCLGGRLSVYPSGTLLANFTNIHDVSHGAAGSGAFVNSAPRPPNPL
ncbi:hypothetical protein EVAR_68952_1 [Eumeta japonica]|uniref:Uncharacterized protein n=1 Tax=Eumeta variegata TaxID=151549 RepID=A0A4C2A4Y7_EUMVA|nr:hypothetical protein EVAR_68952_1 [Eumeta japonica]